MSAAAAWQDDNTAFLSAGVAWVRARLMSLATPGGSETTGGLVEAGPTHDAFIRWDERRDDGPVPALLQLADTLDLSRFEREVLLLCAARALDPGLGALCAAASRDSGKPFPTFALAMRMFDDPAWEALAPSGGLRYWRLIEIHQPANEPLINSPLRADERIVNYIKGLNQIDDRIGSWVRPIPAAGPLPPSHAGICGRIVSVLSSEDDTVLPVVQLLGPPCAAKREIAASIANDIGCDLWRLSVASLADLGGELDMFARLLLRESRLLGAMLHVDYDDEEGTATPDTASTLTRLLDRLEAMPVVLAIRDPIPLANRPTLAEPVGKPTTIEQQQAWLGLLGPTEEATAGLLAGQFNLDIAAIERIFAIARPSAEGDVERALWDAAREAERPRTGGLAERIDAKAGWDDLVLPAPQIDLLRELAAQIRHQWTVYQRWGFGERANRGLGIATMFCGGSGTGKTMAAEVVARHVRLDLYRIDLASVVSKYIGETEKNLRRVFDAFEDGGAILFFDEADALFGKRSEVKDSHDRYANIEINYLLQRMEAYRGLIILATNRRSALDHAFLRRLRFVVDFPHPGVADRERIWRRVFPHQTPIEKLDFDRLARLGLSGGNIQSVAMNAAFRAASEDRAVSMDLILACARAELLKLDLPVNEADFRQNPDMRRIA